MRSANWLLIATGTALLLLTAGAGCGGSTPLSRNDGSAGGGGSGLDGSAGAGGGGGSATGNGGAAGADAAPLTCAPGETCSSGDTCSTTAGCGGGRERACFCDQNGVLACENCQLPDGGTGGASGTDAGPGNACPSGIASGMTCSTQGTFCTATCTNSQTQTCFCTRMARADGGGMTWNCLRGCTVP